MARLPKPLKIDQIRFLKIIGDFKEANMLREKYLHVKIQGISVHKKFLKPIWSNFNQNKYF